MRRFLKWATRKLPLRPIVVNGKPYLDRYYVCGPNVKFFPNEIKPFLKWLPFTLYVHNFHASDEDRELHNHPWQAKSFILAGGYIEEYRVGPPGSRIVLQKVVSPFRFNKIGPDHFHRVDLIEDDAWSLISVGDKSGSWGFWDREKDEYAGWKEYLMDKYPDDDSIQYADGE